MTRGCADSISIRVPELYIDGRWVITLHDIGWFVAAAFALCATAIAIWLLWMHAAYYHKPWEQRHIARILLMLPVYSIISLLSYIFYPWAMAYNTISSAYEAFALCSFFLLLRTYLDPDVRGLKHDLRLREIEYWAWPLSYSFIKRWLHLSPMNGLTWYYIVTFGISQYAILRPTLAVLSIILNHYALYCETSLSPAYGNFYIFVLQSLSVAVAMYCVVAFYLELKEEPALKRNRPLMKLTCIKLVIFLIFWQSIVLQLLAVIGVIKNRNQYWSARDIQTGLNALATCTEMAFFAVLHISAFTYKVYIPEDCRKTTHRWMLVVDAFNFLDFVAEFIKACKWVISGRKRFDPDGFDLEVDDAIYERLRKDRLRKMNKGVPTIKDTIPVVTQALVPALLKLPTPSTECCSFHVPSNPLPLKQESVVAETVAGAPDDLVRPPRLRVLQTRSRSSSMTQQPRLVKLDSSPEVPGAFPTICDATASKEEPQPATASARPQVSKSDRLLGR